MAGWGSSVVPAGLISQRSQVRILFPLRTKGISRRRIWAPLAPQVTRGACWSSEVLRVDASEGWPGKS